MLHVHNLSKTLGDFRLEPISFSAAAGDYFVLLGESGAGKTVILELIAGLLKPDQGSIALNGADVTRAAIQKRGIGLVYQDHALFPHMSVRENIAYGIRDPNVCVEDLAEKLGATALLDRDTGTLSLGESQRVALARALAVSPQILLLDEPLASLDCQSKTRIRSLLRDLNAAGQTIVHVTHDFEEAMALASKVAILEGNRITQEGTPDEVFHTPRSEFVANFVGIRNFFKGALQPIADEVAEFSVAGLTFLVATDTTAPHGSLVLKSEDVTVSASRPEGSARNAFEGTIVEMETVRLGIELTIDVGVKLFAMVAKVPHREVRYQPGMKVWASFKATAARFIPDEVAK